MPSSKDLRPPEGPFFPRQFIKAQFLTKPHPLPKSTNLSGKTAIVTGGNSGLGFECSRQLLSFKLSHLIIAVRSPAKGRNAADKLRAEYPNATTIEVWELDMGSYPSIQALVKRVEDQLDRLDIVILNAGLGMPRFRTVAATGHEEDLQVNFLSTMLLTVLLLPTLKIKSPKEIPGRITIVSSATAIMAKFPTRDAPRVLPPLDDPKNFNSADQYAISKLLGQFFIERLESCVSADDVIVNMVEPGLVKGTGLAREASAFERAIFWVFTSLCGRRVEVGASTYLDAALVQGKESHGGYVMNWEVAPYPPLLYTSEGKKIGEKVWGETLDELSFANANGILQSMGKR